MSTLIIGRLKYHGWTARERKGEERKALSLPMGRDLDLDLERGRFFLTQHFCGQEPRNRK